MPSVADRLLAVACAMLKTGATFVPSPAAKVRLVNVGSPLRAPRRLSGEYGHGASRRRGLFSL